MATKPTSVIIAAVSVASELLRAVSKKYSGSNKALPDCEVGRLENAGGRRWGGVLALVVTN